MITRGRTWRTGVDGTLTLIIGFAMASMSLPVCAEDEPKHNLQKNQAAWKVNVVSELFPEKAREKLQAKIEKGQLVCRSRDSAVLEIPLNAITRVTRDSAKEYPAAEFLMAAAMQPSRERHRFGTKEYRDEMKARAMLGAFAFVGLLFPKHKEVVLVSWKEEDGEHNAEFRMGRKEGRAMLQKLQQETGMEPRDLEKERKDFEKRMKEIRRLIQEESKRSREKPEPSEVP